MSKNSRKNKTTAMPNDQSSDPVVDEIVDAAPDAQPEVLEEAPAPDVDAAPDEAPPAEDLEEAPPAADPEPPAEAPAVEAVLPPVTLPAPATTLSKEVLRSVFNKRTVRYVDDAHWAKAVQAVKDGFEVTFIKREPHLAISQNKFDATAKRVGVNSLNTLIAGMV